LGLQSYTNSEIILVGPYGETYPASHDANQAMNIKDEEISDAQEGVDPMGITIQEIKAEPEVSCMFLYGHCSADNTDMLKWHLSVCTHETTRLRCRLDFEGLSLKCP
jgi:hypothetical protein